MNNIKAILFDIDGTILDTREYIFQSFEYSMKKHGLPLPARSKITKIAGPSLEACYQLLTKYEDIDSLAEAHRQFQENNLHLVVAFAQTLTTLSDIKARGIKVAAITNRSKRSSLASLKKEKINVLLDLTLSIEDVKHLKPHPEPLFKALKHLGYKPEEALMVGDTNIDIEAGKNAGVKTVGVTYGFHGKKIKDAKPDYVIHDIKEIINLLE